MQLNPADRIVWDAVYPDAAPDAEVHDGDTFSVAGTALTPLHTLGICPGSVCYCAADLGKVFTGDTLFHGGPGESSTAAAEAPGIAAAG